MRNAEKVKLHWDNMEMKDPVFAASSPHTAIVTIPVTPSGMACTIELFFSFDGVNKEATSGSSAFTSTGVAQQLSLAITSPAPTTGSSYGVYIVVVSGGVQIAGYRATEDVVIPVVGTPSITWG